MTKAPKTFYLLHGPDDFTLEAEVASLRARLGDEMNTSVFDGETASAAEVLAAVTSYPFLADKRLVIVKGMLSWITRKGAGETGKKAADQIAAALPALPEWARLVFVETDTLPDSNRFVKLSRELENGYEKQFRRLEDATDWIMRRAHEVYGAAIEARAAAALAAATGHDLRRADHELVKLASYAEGRAITEADVDLLTPYLPEAKVFAMVDAMAAGRAGEALNTLHRLLMEKDEDPIRTYGMVVRQFRLLLLAREHLSAGGSSRDMPGALGIKPYEADKLARLARGFSVAQLEAIYRALHDYDKRMKTGRIAPELALDLLISSLGQ